MALTGVGWPVYCGYACTQQAASRVRHVGKNAKLTLATVLRCRQQYNLIVGDNKKQDFIRSTLPTPPSNHSPFIEPSSAFTPPQQLGNGTSSTTHDRKCLRHEKPQNKPFVANRLSQPLHACTPAYRKDSVFDMSCAVGFISRGPLVLEGGRNYWDGSTADGKMDKCKSHQSPPRSRIKTLVRLLLFNSTFSHRLKPLYLPGHVTLSGYTSTSTSGKKRPRFWYEYFAGRGRQHSDACLLHSRSPSRFLGLCRHPPKGNPPPPNHQRTAALPTGRFIPLPFAFGGPWQHEPQSFAWHYTQYRQT